MSQTHEDPYHCNCFAIDVRYANYLRDQLLTNNYFDPLQEDHGQLYGLAANIDETLQFHLKTMPNGQIEAEIEPQTQFLEHLDQNYSSPAHSQVKQVLDTLNIPYSQIRNSYHCLSAKIKKPKQTTSVVGLIALAALGIFISMLSDDES